MSGAEMQTEIWSVCPQGLYSDICTGQIVFLHTEILAVVCLWSAMVFCHGHTHTHTHTQFKHAVKIKTKRARQTVSAQTQSVGSPERRREADRQNSLISVVEVLACLHSLTTPLLWLAAKMNSSIDRWAPPCADKGTEPIERLTVWWSKKRRGKRGVGVAGPPFRAFRQEKSNAYNSTVHCPICMKLYMYDKSPTLKPFICWNSVRLIAPPPGDRKWPKLDMRRTLTNSSYRLDQNVMKTGVDTLQTCDMKSY